MALTGLQIYKLLPQTNCKECGFPTCMAFAMKLAAKQAELSACPYVNDEAKTKLEAAAAPPIRLVTLSSDGHKVAVGNETVLFRHEKTFYHPPGLFVRVRDSQPRDEIVELAAQVAAYKVDYVGIDLSFDGMTIQSDSGDPATFQQCVAAVREVNKGALILMANEPAVLEAGLAAADHTVPLLYAADRQNLPAISALAKQAKTPLVVRSHDGLDELAELTQQAQAAGIQDLVLDTGQRKFGASLATMTQIRRLAIKHGVRALGFPMIAFPGEGVENPADEAALAAQQIAKYAGMVVLDQFTPAMAYARLVLR
ncbi:MAG: acetyl-CoA decarbonylase/synthase complex subunit gamma, partial [Caldilineaceae bacterium]|nr:acetyl-CoA decarbonylase/synthase complex subunit gamma [Caldilineaceae bacterium]